MLIRGNKLRPEVQREVLNAYGYRLTFENETRARAWTPGEFPTAPLVSDAQWLKDHAFYVVADGSRLARNRHSAEPWYLAVDHEQGKGEFYDDPKRVEKGD